MDHNITYCNGIGCVLRNQCRRYQDGQRIKQNVERDTGQYVFMDNCSPENRDGYISIKHN